MGQSIAIIGTGPTGVYCFLKLLEAGAATRLTLFEKGAHAGIGMPYSPETASKSMLANIASIEIPPVGQLDYLQWMQNLPPAYLRSYGLDPDDLDDRQFTPRLLIGQYFRDGLMAAIGAARGRGIEVTVREQAKVTDVIAGDDGVTLCVGGGTAGLFDRVLVATGHVFPAEDEASRSYYPSPWSGLIRSDIPATSVGILGTSLSAIDAAMAVAAQHGRFVRRGGTLTFEPDAPTLASDLHITLMSWIGVLPEADFYCPLPYAPNTIMTDEAIAAAAASDAPLDAAFELFRSELAAADPAYAASIKLDTLSADTFAKAYFAARERADPFKWAARNLAEVEHNKTHRITVPWRYAILRMHEAIEQIVPAMNDSDRKRFDTGLKTVFVDNYAAVPSESIRRVLALRDAGLLSVLALGDDYEMSREPDRTRISAHGKTQSFAVFIDARGQRPQEAGDLPFPTLRKALLSAGQKTPELHDDYSIAGEPTFEGRVVLAAVPYLMRKKPFVQGITAAHEIATAIAEGARRPGYQPTQP